MTGYSAIQKVHKFEERIKSMGFKVADSRYNHNFSSTTGEILSLIPDGTAYPHYTRDAELFTGTLEQANEWLDGVEWATNYYKMLNLVNEKKIARQEDLERQRQLVQAIKKLPVHSANNA